jgi:hypothetical protein
MKYKIFGFFIDSYGGDFYRQDLKKKIFFQSIFFGTALAPKIFLLKIQS